MVTKVSPSSGRLPSRPCSRQVTPRPTVLWHDLAGEAGDQAGPGRAAEPVLTAADEKDFAQVPPGAHLQECVAGSSLYEAATLLYDRFRRPGVGPVKRSKVLHLKRAWLVPIYDTHVHRVYEDRAADLGSQWATLMPARGRPRGWSSSAAPLTSAG
jgi:hypothetical protein